MFIGPMIRAQVARFEETSHPDWPPPVDASLVAAHAVPSPPPARPPPCRYLQHNAVSGAVPSKIGRLGEALHFWDSSHNALSGVLPPTAGELVDHRTRPA